MNARTTKFLFILVALGLTVLLFSWPTQESKLTLSTKMEVVNSAEDLSATNVETLASTVMEKPQFTGEDMNNRHWSLKADRAIQMTEESSGKVSLEKIEASITSANGSPFVFKADEGVFLSGKQEMALNKGVKVKGYGYTLETENLKGNMMTQDLSSKTPIKIEGVKGDLEAGSFSMDGETGKITLYEGVKMHLYLNRTENTYARSIR